MSYLKTFAVSLLCVACLASGAAWAADRPYTQGSVWTVTFVRVKPGLNSQYLGDLASTWKRVMDEARKQQLIVSYKILGGNPGNREDWDLMLLVESKTGPRSTAQTTSSAPLSRSWSARIRRRSR